MFDGAQFHPNGEPLPDGTDPWALQKKWSGWIREATVLMDGDGTFRHFPYGSTLNGKVAGYREQPAFDMDVLEVVRRTWNGLQNAKMKAERDAVTNTRHSSSR